ncbi:hypothetical protein CBS101457_006137 [Exobasidium rhododendri]|nr:hypothetical protein CBS101457_006137 [Exobasidium rhododendri]
MPPPTKERYNSKARQSSVGSSHKKRRKIKATGNVGQEGEVVDHSNALVIDPEVEEAKRARREDPSNALAPISSKKRKRLDAYIARQLKKDNRSKLMADLAKSSAQVEDRSALMTAATLGTGKVLTGQERIQNDIAKEEKIQQRRRGVDFSVVDELLSGEEDAMDEERPSKDGLKEVDSGNNSFDGAREARIAKARALFTSSEPVSTSLGAQDRKTNESESKIPSTSSISRPTAVGSALALGPDGKPLSLVVRQRRAPQKKRGGTKTAWGRARGSIESSQEDETDFDSSASSESGEEEEAFTRDHDTRTNMGGVKKNFTAQDEDGNQEDLHEDESASDLSESDAEYSGEQTDEEEQAVLLEAMRLRGMLGRADQVSPNFEEEEEREDEKDVEEEGNAIDSEAESLPFAAFEGIYDGQEKEEGVANTDSEREESEEGEEGEESGEDDSDDDGDDTVTQSRRHGLPLTDRSHGFKGWAKEALGLGASTNEGEEEDDGVYRGPEPVAGLSVKVKDLMDGKIRGPLGEDEPTLQERSAFAQRYYEEVNTREGKGITGLHANKDRVHIQRSEEVQEARLKLPVLAEEERIIRTVMENMVTVLCGETGSGKTTQLPQFLYEAGFGTAGTHNPGMIGITQPRRVAALSMAARVGTELGLPSSKVSHQIRYDATTSPSTSIKFMTDGVLLRELAADFLLTKYSAIVIDEAHERSVNTDVLIGVLSRVVKLRAKRWIQGQGRPLRMIIMSATLRVEDFVGNTRLFDEKPPLIEIDARQHPVTTHFNRKTVHDYVEESVKKASKIHARLPPGGILIFMTGQAEITLVCRKLEKRYGRKAVEGKARLRARFKKQEFDDGEDDDENRGEDDRVTVSAKNGDVEAEEVDLSFGGNGNDDGLALDVDDGRTEKEDDDEALDTDDEQAGDEQDYDADLPEELRDDSDVAMHILPLYSLLPSDKQMRVFEAPPPNTRLVIVATNVAETSLTIPGITYVVDCGRSKERKYDVKTGVQSFEVDFISKASANQRAGRAGRTGPGHCYRLYSSNVFEEHFQPFAEAEILRTPVDNLVLMMKSMNIDNVANFPFPTAPNREALRRAERLLLRLGALEVDVAKVPKGNYKITDLGRSMSLFPLATRLSKLLVQGHQYDCLPFVIALVAALSVGDPFIKEESLYDMRDVVGGDNEEAEEEELAIEAKHITNADELEKEKHKATRSGYFKALNQFAALSGALSDPLRLLSIVGAYEHEGGSLSFCQKHYLIPKSMQEIHKLRAQLSSMVQANANAGTDWSHLSSPKFKSPPSAKQLTVLRQFLTAAFIDQVAIRADLAPESAARIAILQESTSTDSRIAKQFQNQLRNGAKMKSTRDVAYLGMGIPGEACFIHKASVLFHQSPPDWIIFSEVFRSRRRGDTMEVEGRNWLKGVTKINANWIHKLGKPLCTFGRTIEVDPKDTRAKLIEAAKEMKRRQGDMMSSSGSSTSSKASLATGEKQVIIVPTYGNGPAFDASERSSHVGWELPAITAKQKLVGGRWVTDLL